MDSVEDAIAECLGLLDSSFLKAISEPVRIEILKIVVLQRRCDVATVASRLPQDRSVVARHLQMLARAQVLRASNEGRHTFYEVDGDGIVGQLKTLVELAEKLSPMCCPPQSH